MFLKKIDIYGSKLGFTLKKQSNLNSICGGIFTILTYVLYIIIFCILAKDYYFKINPKIIFDKVYLTDKLLNNYTFINDTFLFAYSSQNTLEHPNLYNISFRYLIISGENTTKINLDLINCNETKQSKLFHQYAENYSCIDYTKILKKNLTNFDFFSAEENNIVTFSVRYNYDYLATLNETYKQLILNSTDTIYILFPRISFSPNNYNNPLDIYLDYNWFNINKKETYYLDLKYSQTLLEEDQNFIFDRVSIFDSVIHFEDKREIVSPRNDNNADLAYIWIYLDGLYYNNYKRIYKKLPEILAQVYGIMSPFIIVCSFLIEYFTKYHLDNFLVDNFLCYFNKNQNEDNRKFSGNLNYKDYKNLFKNLNISKVSSESDFIKKFPKSEDNNFNKIKENFSDSDFLKKMKTKFSLSAYTEIKKSQNTNHDFINEINIEYVDVINKRNIITDNRALDEPNPLNIYSNSKISKNKQKEEKKAKLIDKWSINIKTKNAFPYIGFIEYYFPVFIYQKNKNYYYSIRNYQKVLKYFSKEILKKLDLVYYFKLVRIIEILKNTYLRKKVEKKSLQFLLKNLYFVRDCDIKSIVQEIDEKFN